MQLPQLQNFQVPDVLGTQMGIQNMGANQRQQMIQQTLATMKMKQAGEDKLRKDKIFKMKTEQHEREKKAFNQDYMTNVAATAVEWYDPKKPQKTVDIINQGVKAVDDPENYPAVTVDEVKEFMKKIEAAKGPTFEEKEDIKQTHREELETFKSKLPDKEKDKWSDPVVAGEGDKLKAGTVYTKKDDGTIKVLETPERKSVYDLSKDEVTITAKSVASGLRAPKTISARRERGQILTEVSRMHPKYDFSKSDANYNYMNNSSVLRSAGMVQSAMPRVYDLYRKSLALQNLTNVPILDAPINKVRRLVGDEAVVDFESLRNAVLMEVNAALSGTSVASDYRIKLELENLKSGMTVGQQTKSISNLISALEARGEAAQMVVYPWDVVRGERTIKAWKADEKAESKKVKGMIFGGGSGGIEQMTDTEILNQLGIKE